MLGQSSELKANGLLEYLLWQGTEIPSSSPSRDVKGEREKSEGREGKGKSPIKGALDINMLKNIKSESSSAFRNTCSTNGIEIIDVDDIEPTRKRKCLFEG